MSSGPKKCGKCEKTVYPVEEIICLDKSWHKGCLKCSVCGTTLNIKTVKGYEKMPYCNAHYPQLKSTPIADNPELQRMRQLQDVQSNAKYHKDFNESKGKFTVIADDPATQRAKEQQRNVSQVEYTSKRKESTSHVIEQDSTPQSNERKSSTTEKPLSAVGQLADYDPLNGNAGSLSRGYEPSSNASNEEEFQGNKSGLSVSNSKSDSDNQEKRKSNQEEQPQTQTVEAPSATKEEPLRENPPADNKSSKKSFRALYSYAAAEADELSFEEGDIIAECEEVDEGWMMGVNSKTGAKGLLPSNYVESL